MERHIKSSPLHTGIHQKSEHLKTLARQRGAFHRKSSKGVYLQKTISATPVTSFVLSQGFLGSEEQEPKKVAC